MDLMYKLFFIGNFLFLGMMFLNNYVINGFAVVFDVRFTLLAGVCLAACVVHLWLFYRWIPWHQPKKLPFSQVMAGIPPKKRLALDMLAALAVLPFFLYLVGWDATLLNGIFVCAVIGFLFVSLVVMYRRRLRRMRLREAAAKRAAPPIRF